MGINKKTKIIILFISLFLKSVSSQTSNEITRPSVNINQFFSVFSSSVNRQIGQPTVNIPLFDLPGKGINIPISIAFNAGNITYESESSHIGLGWSLLAGGVISHTVIGTYDLGMFYEYDTYKQSDYIQRQWIKEKNNYTDLNMFEQSLLSLTGLCGEDETSYSFLGHKGMLKLEKGDNNQVTATVIPDRGYKCTPTDLGYKITDIEGITYFFEEKELVQDHDLGYFLSRIETPNEGEITFIYDDETAYNYSSKASSGHYKMHSSKRISKIISDYGYVKFDPAYRSDRGGPTGEAPKRISNIELYNNDDELIKGYKLEGSYAVSSSTSYGPEARRFLLNKVTQYNINQEYLSPYIFTYDYKFSLDKASGRDQPYEHNPAGGWATNQTQICAVDLSFEGVPDCWKETKRYTDPITGEIYDVPTEKGIAIIDDLISGHTIGDYFYLKSIKKPTGSREIFQYEKHDIYKIGHSDDSLSLSYKGSSGQNLIIGRRLKTKIVHDSNSNSQTFQYKYRLHDKNHAPITYTHMGHALDKYSSGVLAYPSIHTTLKYTPNYDDENNTRLVCTPVITDKPQNSYSMPVYYSEVEEILGEPGIEIGRKIYYYDNMGVSFPKNYVYLSKNKRGSKANILIPIEQKLHKNFTRYPEGFEYLELMNYMVMGYPLGRFSLPDGLLGQVKKEVTIDKNGDVIKETEYAYTNDDASYNNYLVDYSDKAYGVYHISHSIITHYYYHLRSSTTTEYYKDEENNKKTIISGTKYEYNREKQIREIKNSVNNKENMKKEYYYPQNLSSTANNNRLINNNRYPIVKELLYNNETLVEEKYYDYKVFDTSKLWLGESYLLSDPKNHNSLLLRLDKDNQISGAIPFEIYSSYFDITTERPKNEYFIKEDDRYAYFELNDEYFNEILEVIACDPSGSFSFVDRHFKPTTQSKARAYNKKCYLKYNSQGNPLKILSPHGIYTYYIWGFDGRYPLVKIESPKNIDINISIEDNMLSASDNKSDIDNDIAYLKNITSNYFNNKNFRLTIYTYKPYFGLTSETDANGNSIFYKYDNFGRLVSIKDQDGNIIKTYDYHLSNQ